MIISFFTFVFRPIGQTKVWVEVLLWRLGNLFHLLSCSSHIFQSLPCPSETVCSILTYKEWQQCSHRYSSSLTLCFSSPPSKMPRWHNIVILKCSGRRCPLCGPLLLLYMHLQAPMWLIHRFQQTIFGLFVLLSVSRITQILLKRFQWNFCGELGHDPRRKLNKNIWLKFSKFWTGLLSRNFSLREKIDVVPSMLLPRLLAAHWLLVLLQNTIWVLNEKGMCPKLRSRPT